MKKKEIYDMIILFGLHIDYDKYEEKGWIRVQHLSFKEHYGFQPLIIWKEYIEKSSTYLQEELQKYLIRIGEYNFKLKLHNLISLDEDN